MKKVRLAEFQPARLTQARRIRGWTMAELADRTGLTRQAISAFEKTDSGLNPKPETLRVLADALDVEPAFLTCALRTGEEDYAIESAVSFRTLVSSSKRNREQAKVYLQMLAGIGSLLEDFIDLPQQSIPDFGIDDFTNLDNEEIEGIAEKTRRFFGLGDGPIPDLTLLLENRGVLIGYVPLASGMDGISAWIAGRPTIVISEKAYAARSRFDLAHELGHLILHRSLTNDELEIKGMLKKVEDQANYFASCFLLPEHTFAKEIYSTDEKSLLAIKERWGVSMQAVIMRLHSIGLITEWQKIRAFQQISVRGQRKKEPLDDSMIPERSRLTKKAVQFLNEHNILDVNEFFVRATYPKWFIESITGLEKSSATNSNIVPFRLKQAN